MDIVLEMKIQDFYTDAANLLMFTFPRRMRIGHGTLLQYRAR